MWIIISVILGVISLMAIIDISEKKKRIYALAYENAYLYMLLHKHGDKELKDIISVAEEKMKRND